MTLETTTCPGCGIEMPRGSRSYDRKFHASAECWAVFEDVIAAEFQNPFLFGQVHQLTVDTYCVQHAGGRHPDKSVCIHLVGLYWMLEQDLPPVRVAPFLQRLARRSAWPHLEPPAERAALTVRDISLAGSAEEHARRVRAWAEDVWRTWRPHQGVARELAADLNAVSSPDGRSGRGARP